MQQQRSGHAVEQVLVAGLGAGQRATRLLFGADVAGHPPEARQPALAIKFRFTVQQAMAQAAVGMQPAHRQVGQRLGLGQAVAQGCQRRRVELQQAGIPDRAPHHFGQWHEAALRVAPRQLGQSAAGIGFPIGAGGHAQQGQEALLAGLHDADVLPQQPRHGPADP